MGLPTQAEITAVKLDAEGVARVGGTRVTLDTVVYAFNRGATPEEIVQQYPALKLADVYGAIAYYLQFRADVDAYIALRERDAARIRQANEARFESAGSRARLLARQSERE
ncbi:MAG: DUF433 domain-containing protein [Chloroflexi bacterium]|nr:DUF433 domain-containing protein [Chloroflexota bacterium]